MRFFSLATLASAPILTLLVQQASAQYAKDLPSTVSQPISGESVDDDFSFGISLFNYTGFTAPFAPVRKLYNTTALESALNSTLAAYSQLTEAALGCNSTNVTAEGFVSGFTLQGSLWNEIFTKFDDNCVTAIAVAKGLGNPYISEFVVDEVINRMESINEDTVCFSLRMIDQTTGEAFNNTLLAAASVGVLGTTQITGLITPVTASLVLDLCDF